MGIRSTLDFSPQALTHSLPLIVERKKDLECQDNLRRAQAGSFHDLYPFLSKNTEPYFTDKLPAYAIGLILKARGDLLNLNGRAFKDNTLGLCTICNMDAVEDTHHLIGVCPIYRAYRLKYFGSRLLSREEVISVLNSNNFSNIFNFIKDCLQYRELIINEFS